MAKSKRLLSILLLFVVSILVLGTVSALDASVDWVKVDGDNLDQGTDNVLSLDRDASFEVKVKITPLKDLDNVELNVRLSGYDHPNKVSETSDVFDMEENVSKIKTLKLKFPGNMDEDHYKLRVQVSDRDSDTLEEVFELKVDPVRHSIVIKDVDVDPSHEVVAGRSVRALVNLKNYGQIDEEDVKIEFKIAELGLEALPDYVDIEEDDNKVSEELYIRIPTCTQAGTYNGEVLVSYHDDDYVATESVSIYVVESELCQAQSTTSTTTTQTTTPAPAQTQVTVGVASQDVVKGEGGVIYPITFTNPSAATKTYVVGVNGADDWATVKVSPLQTVTLAGGETKSVYVYLSARESAAAGEKMFSVDIKDSTGALMEQVALSANVVEGDDSEAGDGSSLKRGLEIALIVLVIILIIVGLVIAFKKRNEEDDEDDEELGGQTYY
ncbi:hypothetical protein HN587_05515 [Candidatus Woesearchaeota archaeon]|jgi:hypothetical protein|nr:hypothetical protein [Candidatus Woesearchaeota archaeon]